MQHTYFVFVFIFVKGITSPFTIPEMESERKINLNFLISFAALFDAFI